MSGHFEAETKSLRQPAPSGQGGTLLSETADVALIRQPNGYNGRLIEMDWMAFFVCENRVDLIRLAEPVRWGQIG